MEKRSIFSVLLVATLLAGTAECQSPDATQFLFVHGAAHGAWCWYKVVTILQKAGFKAAAVDLTSHGRDKTHADNVTTLAQYAKPLTDYLANVSGKVVLVGHSMGGVSISYAMELYPEKISKAIFVAALMPLNNQSGLASVNPDAFPRLLRAHLASINFANGPSAPATSMAVNLSLAAHFFYNKSPPQDVALSLSLLDPEPYCSLADVLTLTPSRYGSIRRFYVRTDFDNVLLPAYQQEILNQNPPEEVFLVDGSDHSAFFSRTRQFTSLLVCISTLCLLH